MNERYLNEFVFLVLEVFDFLLEGLDACIEEQLHLLRSQINLRSTHSSNQIITITLHER